MNDFVQTQIANQRCKRLERYGAQELQIFHKATRPSWKRYGDGVASLEVSARINAEGVPSISLTAMETALADGVTQKRDTTKETHFTAYGPAARALYELLRDVFEPAAEVVA